MTRPRAADDFTTIRARIDELRRDAVAPNAAEHQQSGCGDAALADRERRLKDRREGCPPPWVPTIFLVAPGGRSGVGAPRARYSSG